MVSARQAIRRRNTNRCDYYDNSKTGELRNQKQSVELNATVVLIDVVQEAHIFKDLECRDARHAVRPVWSGEAHLLSL